VFSKGEERSDGEDAREGKKRKTRKQGESEGDAVARIGGKKKEPINFQRFGRYADQHYSSLKVAHTEHQEGEKSFDADLSKAEEENR